MPTDHTDSGLEPSTDVDGILQLHRHRVRTNANISQGCFLGTQGDREPGPSISKCTLFYFSQHGHQGIRIFTTLMYLHARKSESSQLGQVTTRSGNGLPDNLQPQIIPASWETERPR